MLSKQALQTREYCGQCGKDTPSDKLEILFSRTASTELLPNPDWQ